MYLAVLNLHTFACPLMQVGFEPATFRKHGRDGDHYAICARTSALLKRILKDVLVFSIYNSRPI